jgi:hypothetical protein
MSVGHQVEESDKKLEMKFQSSTDPSKTEERMKEGGGWGEVAQTMYRHVSKCKNMKLKGGKKRIKEERKGGRED